MEKYKTEFKFKVVKSFLAGEGGAMNNKSNRFSPEVCERAVRMVQEHRGECLDFTLFRRHISTSNYRTFATVRTWPKAPV